MSCNASLMIEGKWIDCQRKAPHEMGSGEEEDYHWGLSSKVEPGRGIIWWGDDAAMEVHNRIESDDEVPCFVCKQRRKDSRSC